MIGCEERSPDPKPRWNPRPEQIRILEAIFNSGMVNPPRDEIRKIRAQLQEYGQVGDANVFYWFQNRKSRSKQKQRHVQSTNKLAQPPQQIPLITSSTAPTTKAALSSSSSSSEKSSSQNSADKTLSLGSKNVLDASSSPTASVNQPFFHPHSDFLPVPFFFPVQQQQPPPPPTLGSTSAGLSSQGFCFPDAPNVSHAADNSTIQNSTSLFLSDLLLMNHAPTKKVDEDRIKLQETLSGYTVNTSPSAAHQSQSISFPTNIAALSTLDHIPGNIF